jgi:lipoprotein NlpI
VLREGRVLLSKSDWATVLVDYYLGSVSESAVVAALVSDVSSQSQLNHRLCEAYFYLGKLNAQKGNIIKAENYFKLALSTNVFEYVEHKYARIELTKLRQARIDKIQAQQEL